MQHKKLTVVYGGLTFSTLTFSTPLRTTPVGPPFLLHTLTISTDIFSTPFITTTQKCFICMLIQLQQVTFTITTTLWGGGTPCHFQHTHNFAGAFFPMHPPCATNTFINFFDYCSELLF